MENITLSVEEVKAHKCKHCNKTFNHTSSLYRHQKSCKGSKSESESDNEQQTNLIDYESKFNMLYDMILKQNKEIELLKQTISTQNNKIEEQNKSIINLQNNIIQIKSEPVVKKIVTKSKEQTFNLEQYLNEDCKDAININDWIDQNYKPEKIDFEKYLNNNCRTATGLIVIKYLNKMKQTERPIQLLDQRRNHFKIKDNGKWLDSDDINDLFKKLARKLCDITYKRFWDWQQEYKKEAIKNEKDKDFIDNKCDVIMMKVVDSFYLDNNELQSFIVQIIQSCKVEK
jgi:hypothetical protein